MSDGELKRDASSAATAQRSGAARFGNFPDYYKFNPIENRTRYIPEDFLEQLGLASQEKVTILDVGCNTGDLTMALVDKLRAATPESVARTTFEVLGVDIDSDLIARAERTVDALGDLEERGTFTFRAGDLLEPQCVQKVRAFLQPHQTAAMHTTNSKIPCGVRSELKSRNDSTVCSIGDCARTRSSQHDELTGSTSSGSSCSNQETEQAELASSERAEGCRSLGQYELTDQTTIDSFQSHQESDQSSSSSKNSKRRERFDIVFAFGVTMWIHLNSGDSELFRFLDTLASLGEYVVLEPQPWKCYKAARKRARRLGAAGFPLYDSLTIRSSAVETEIHEFMSRDTVAIPRSDVDGKEEVGVPAADGRNASGASHSEVDKNDNSDGRWWNRSGCGMKYSRLLGETKWGRDVRVYSRTPMGALQ